MSQETPVEATVEVTSPWGRVRAHGIDAIVVMTFIAVVISGTLTGVFLWEHKNQAIDGEKALTAAIKELTRAARSGNSAQREMNCLISLPQEKREQEFNTPNGFCKRLTRVEE